MAETKNPVKEASRSVEAHVKYWVGEIDKAKKREKAWRKEARELIQIYEGDYPELIPYNILYSNTETLGPALYSAIPRPDTRPRTAQESATAMAASGLCDAYLENFIDNGDQGYCSFDSATKVAVKSALVPGRGVQRFHYFADIEKDDAGSPRKVKYERVDAEEWAWDKILTGYAKTWQTVPWLAYEHVWTREEAEEHTDATTAARLTYQLPDPAEDPKKDGESVEDRVACATVYEIWHKTSKQIFWVEADARREWVKDPEPDPYRLDGFYPSQEPLRFMRRLSSLLPVPLYRLYKQQAGELNKITRRIDKVIDQIKIRGFYDEGVEDLKTVLEADDGVLHPVRNLQSLGQGAKVENAVWLVPVEKHTPVLQALLQERQAVKQVIFEIMGIADIMRGSSVASETLGAQKIKNQWGTLRLKDAQAEVARFIRDGLRIAAELGFSKLSPETLRKITGSQLPSKADHDKLEAMAQQAKATGQPLPPEVMAQMALPSFEECLEALKDDFVRGYLVDIETNSSIDADAAEDKEQITEFLAAFSQLLNGLGPMIEKGVMPFTAARAIMLSIAKRFNLGKQLYRQLASMEAPKPAGGPDPKAMKALQDQQAKLEQQAKAQEQQANQLKLEKIQLDSEKRIFDIQQQAAKAIADAQKTAKDAQSTAAGATKAAESKVKEVQATSKLEKLMMDLATALHDMQTQANTAKSDDANRKAVRQAEDGAKAEGESNVQALVDVLQKGLGEMGKSISEGLVKAASVKRKAVKGPDGWTSEVAK